jgi:hypothetical protein
MEFEMPDVAPIAIGGIGGSGTRVVAETVAKLGVYMGSDINDSLDNETYTLLFKRAELWPVERNEEQLSSIANLFVSYMRGTLRLDGQVEALLISLSRRHWDYYPAGWSEERRQRILARVDKANGLPSNALWGWKEPNTHIFLPWFLDRFPELKYIHVVRHGLDMAYSSNQNQLRLWGSTVQQRPIKHHSAEESFKYWCWAHRRINSLVGAFPNRILTICYEEFCLNPEAAILKIADFISVEASSELIESMHRSVSKPNLKERYVARLDFEPAESDLAVLTSLGYDFKRC